MIFPYLDTAMQILIFILFFSLIILIGIFSYRFSVSIDKNTIKSIGDFLYKIMCKSGFMVIVIVIATYVICKNESANRLEKISSDHLVASPLVKE